MTLKSRYLAVLTAASILAISTAACGGAGGSGSTNAGADGAELTMWTFKQSHVAGLRAAAAAFKQETGTSVRVEVTTPQEAYISKIQAGARTKSLPDLLTVGSGDESFKYAAAGILRDVTADFDASMRDQMLPGVADAAQLTAAAIETSKADPQNSFASLRAGNWYGFPYVAGASGIVLGRKSALERAGVDETAAAGSYEGFVRAVTATHAQSSTSGGLVTGMQIPETALTWLYDPLSYYYLGEDGYVSRQGPSPATSWTSPESLKTFELYDQLSKLWAPGVMALGIDQADQAFAAGKAAWDIGGTYTLPFLLQQGMRTEDLVIFPLPAAAGGRTTQAKLASAPILSAGVTTQSKNPQLATQFAQYLATGRGADIFAKTAVEVPASTRAADELAKNPLMASVVDALKAGSTDVFRALNYVPPGAPPVVHTSAVALARLVDGSSTPAQVADEFADIYSAAWKKAGK